MCGNVVCVASARVQQKNHNDEQSSNFEIHAYCLHETKRVTSLTTCTGQTLTQQISRNKNFEQENCKKNYQPDKRIEQNVDVTAPPPILIDCAKW